jgi:hypothetical protein
LLVVKNEARILELAKAIILQEQEISAREHDIARRRRELEAKERELVARRDELERLRVLFSAAAQGQSEAGTEESQAAARERRTNARAEATVAQRVLAVLEMEPRALAAGEIFNLLELKPPMETLRTTLWKMENHGLIARPYLGHYCALQHLAVIMGRGAS